MMQNMILVSTGEQAACALIAGRLNHMGLKSRSWMSWQIPSLQTVHTKVQEFDRIVSKNY